MLTIDKANIREKSFTDLFDSFIRYRTLSRSQIAAASGLSPVTVSRVLDALLDAGILIQREETEYIGKSTHKSEIFDMANFGDFNIIDISDGNFDVYSFSTDQLPQIVYSRLLRGEFDVEEKIAVVLYALKKKDIELSKNCGVIFPIKNADRFNISGEIFTKIPDEKVIPEIISEIFPDTRIYRFGRDHAVKNGAVTDIYNTGSQNILYICLENLFCTLTVSGGTMITQPFDGFGAGLINDADGENILKSLSRIEKTDQLIPLLATVANLYMATVAPKKIVISSGKFKLKQSFAQQIRRCICTWADPYLGLTYRNTPDVFISKMPLHVMGASHIMMRDYFETVLKNSGK